MDIKKSNERDRKRRGRWGRRRWQKVDRVQYIQKLQRGASVWEKRVEGHKSGWVWLSWLPSSTLGLFRWPSPSASSCHWRHCLLSVLKKPRRKRNVSEGRKRSTSWFYGFLVSVGTLTDWVTWAEKHDLWADVWKKNWVMGVEIAVNFFNLHSSSESLLCVILQLHCRFIFPGICVYYERSLIPIVLIFHAAFAKQLIVHSKILLKVWYTQFNENSCWL